MLSEELRKTALSAGADLVGFVNLSARLADFSTYGFSIDPKTPFAISIGMSLIDSLVDRMTPATPSPVCKLFRTYCYDIVNDRLNDISFRIATILQKAGHAALPIPASPSSSDGKLHFGYFSHKAAARLSGLGWIGPSCLLVTPEFGPRIRWATVFTDAPVGPEPEPMESRCGKCVLCVQSCPSQAFTGRHFVESEPREMRMDSMKCHTHLERMEQEKGVRVCGVCVAVCPYGRNA